MPYLATTILALALVFLETSLLPHFKILGAVPFIALAFTIGLAVRFRGVFHLILALFIGMLLDFLSGGIPGTFTGVFVSITLIGRVLFFRDTGYDATQSFLWLLGASSTLIYFIQSILIFQVNFTGWQKYLIISISGIILTLVTGYIIYKFFDKYFDWLNKKNEEMYR